MKKFLFIVATFVLCLSATFVQAAEAPPAGYVSLYSLTYVGMAQTDQTGAVGAVASKQLVGPGSGWGSGATYYDISRYDTLSVKITFDAADAGKQVAIRAAFNKTNAPTAFLITYPADGSTSMVYKIGLTGKTSLDGMFFYNGATHFSFTYTTGMASTKAANIDYVALETIQPTALNIVPVDPIVAGALPYSLSTTLNAVFTPVNATYNTVTWESLNPGIATVSTTGVVTAGNTAAGTVGIKVTSVTYPALSSTFNVNVVASSTPVASVNIDSSTVNLKLLTTRMLTYAVLPTTSTNKKVSWISSDVNVATVDSTGKVTPIAAGNTTITVTTADGSFTDNCVVTVLGILPIPKGYTSLYSLKYNEEGTEKDLSTNLLTLGATVPALFTSNASSLLGTVANWNRYNKYVDLANFSELQVACTFKPEDLGKSVEFRYAFSRIAGVDAAGSTITNRFDTITSTNMLLKIKLDKNVGDLDSLKRLGAVKFRNSSSGTLTFNIDYVAVKAIVPASVELIAADTMKVKALLFDSTTTLQVLVKPINALDKSVVWKSLTPAIATVSPTGVVTANSTVAGIAAIKVTSVADSTLSDTFNVTVVSPRILVKSVSITTKSIKLEVGKTATLTHAVLPVNATNDSVRWSSSNISIATVSNGVVTAVRAGTAIIKLIALEDSTLYDSCAVTVKLVPEGYVSLYSLIYVGSAQTDQTGAVGAVTSKQVVGQALGWGDGILYYDIARYDTMAIKLTFDPTDAGKQVAIRAAYNTTKVVTPVIVTLPNDGSTSYIYKFGLAGKNHLDGMVFYNGASHWSFTYTGTPTAKAINIDYIALETIPATALAIVPVDSVVAKALPFNLTTTLNAVFTPVNATYNAVTWESLNPSIATVNASGLVTAGGTTAGAATIKVTSVTYPSLSVSYVVNVVAASNPVASVNIDSSAVRLKLLNTKMLSYSVLPANATNKKVTWSSSDVNVATVDSTGKVTPIAAGTAKITVVTADGSFTDNCDVTVVGFLPIPQGYTSLYTLKYNEEGTEKELSANLLTLGATVPAIFTSNASSLLGTGANWNRYNKYVDLTNYSELQVACTFKTEDIGKSVEFRYAFSKKEGVDAAGSTITNRIDTITSENMILTIKLDKNVGDVDSLKHLGAIKFRNTASGTLTFNIDYVAVKLIPPVGISKISLEKDGLVNVYSITGMLIRRAVKESEATLGLEKGIYIVGKKKVLVTK